MQPRVRCVARRDHKVVNSVVNERDAWHQPPGGQVLPTYPISVSHVEPGEHPWPKPRMWSYEQGAKAVRHGSALVGTAPGRPGCRVCRLRDLAGVLASSSAASRSCLFFHSLQIMSAIHPRRPPTPTARVVMAARPRPTTAAATARQTPMHLLTTHEAQL